LKFRATAEPTEPVAPMIRAFISDSWHRVS
jgi:hypothetical protein